MWDILHDIPPAAFIFQHGDAAANEENVRRIRSINPHCKFVMRMYRKWTEPADHAAYIRDAKAAIALGSWSAIPKGDRILQIYNEVNMPHTTTPPGMPNDQWEGFGPTQAQKHDPAVWRAAMESFNEWFVRAWYELKAVNPTWRIAFPAFTPGNFDAFFDTDLVGADYFSHGPEASRGNPCDPGHTNNPTPEQIEAAKASCICAEALRLAEVYLAHIYVMNDVAFQMRELWAGMRWLQYYRFLTEPKPVIISELGINGAQEVSEYHEILRTQYPEVFATGIWQLGEAGYDDPNTAFVQSLRNYVRSLPEAPPREWPPPVVPEAPPEPPIENQQLRAAVGLQLRNDHHIPTADGGTCTEAVIEACKVMNFTIRDGAVPGIDQILEPTWLVRLWDGRFGVGRAHPSPAEFVDGVRGGIDHWYGLARFYEIHNEPNHVAGIEGWGATAEDAANFAAWYTEVYDRLRSLYPGSDVFFGFPGLAPGAVHNDLAWLEICREAIELRSDFLGCHTYWQNIEPGSQGHLAEEWGLRYRRYLERFPNKSLIITEYANTQGLDGHPVNYYKVGDEYAEYLAQVFADSWDSERGLLRILAAHSFICSSGDMTWHPLSWQVAGSIRPIASKVGAMQRPPLYGDIPVEPPEDTKTLEEKVREAVWNATGRKVAYNPWAALTKRAHALDGDPPITPEIRVEHQGEVYVGQGWFNGIYFCKDGDWSNIQIIDWIVPAG
jgi:hypothetical protein